MTMKLLATEFTSALLILVGMKLLIHSFVFVHDWSSKKRFPPPNFNLKFVRTQCGLGSWMLLDALFHCWERSASPPLKNIMTCFCKKNLLIVSCKLFQNLQDQCMFLIWERLRIKSLKDNSRSLLKCLDEYARNKLHNCGTKFSRQLFLLQLRKKCLPRFLACR